MRVRSSTPGEMTSPAKRATRDPGHCALPSLGLAISILLLAAKTSLSQTLLGSQVDNFEGRPRVVVLTDIGNEPDDQMSFVRLLLYSNELDLEGLIATTSTWQKGKVRPDTLHELIAAYAELRPNLLEHATGWPEAAKLDAVVTSGQLHYGMAFIMEGDTPSFLGLTNNGLNSYRNPSWGGWGGRYVHRTPYGETHPIWSQGGDIYQRVTSEDSVAGIDGKTYVSDQATVWRWREAFQHDFAARMDWTIKPHAGANHNPLVTVNGETGTAPIVIDAEVGTAVNLDAGGSRDPDGRALSYKWFHYPEAGFVPGQGMAAVTISGDDAPKATVLPTAACLHLCYTGCQ